MKAVNCAKSMMISVVCIYTVHLAARLTCREGIFCGYSFLNRLMGEVSCALNLNLILSSCIYLFGTWNVTIFVQIEAWVLYINPCPYIRIDQLTPDLYTDKYST